MKKLIAMSILAFSLFAAGHQRIDPVPMCDPCPWVR
jgi:hypothetical protein